MIIKEPSSIEEFEEYYELRWKVLREPWKKPRGSEKDEMENDCIHAMAINETGSICGVIRLQQNSSDEGQIRFMGVDTNSRTKGIGSALLKYMEIRAKKLGIISITLHARENAIGFYLKNNYLFIGESYLMWNTIQHFEMKKEI